MEMHPQREKNELMAAETVDAINAENMAPSQIGYDRDKVNTYRRAHLASALQALRDMLIDKRTKPDTWETRNARLLAAFRVKAMLLHQIEAFRGYEDFGEFNTAAWDGIRQLAELTGIDTAKALHSIAIELAKYPGNRAEAISSLTSLLEEAPAEDNEGEEAAKTAKHIEMMQTPEAPPPGPQSAPTVQSLLKELDALTGLNAVKQEVHSLVNYLRVQRLRLEQSLPNGQITTHLVFTGNPGTGKTTVARLLAKLYQAVGFLPSGQFVETDRSGLVAGYVGQTAIRTSEVVKKAIGGVLFIDEAYALNEQGLSGGDAFGREAIDTLLKLMEDNRDQLVVIVAGYPALMQQFLASNPGLQSRFTRFINFPDYSPKDLLQIFSDMTSRQAYTLTDAALQHVSDLLRQAYESRGETFGNARLVRTMFEQATVRLSDRCCRREPVTREELTTLHAADIELPRECC
jgi:SpoVK/Ycf46/Vps4 family AAA+-type ATPase